MPKNYGKNITSVNTPIKFYLPDGTTSQIFKDSLSAQNWFNQNYANGYSMLEYIPMKGDEDHPIELDEIVVTAPAKKIKSTSNSSERTGFDRFIGANYSPRFNRAYNKMGMNPLNWHKYIPKSYWNSETHKNVVEGGDAAAVVAAAPFFAYAAGEYVLPWLANTVAPYLSANGWLTATQAAGNTPAWLTPTSATAIDAGLAGYGTAASINDMRENGPTVGNVIGTGLGVAGLTYEAYPTIMKGYLAVKNMYNTSKPVSKSIQVLDLTYPGRKFYYYDGDNLDSALLCKDLKQGRQDFIDWMNHPKYIKATQANKAEAESMGLSYTPIHEKPSYQLAILYENFKPKLKYDLIGSQGLVSQSMSPGQMDLNIHNKLSLRPVVRHELAHSSRLAWDDGKLLEINPSYKPSQEIKYLRFKNSEVFDDGADFSKKAGSKFYDFTKDGFPHEAVTNTRDLGERIGIKVGQEYPGDEKVLEIIDDIIAKNPTSLYGQMASHFNRNNPRAVWKALNGTLWALISGVASYPILNNTK